MLIGLSQLWPLLQQDWGQLRKIKALLARDMGHQGCSVIRQSLLSAYDV